MRRPWVIVVLVIVALLAINFFFHPFSSGSSKEHARGGDRAQSADGQQQQGGNRGGGRRGGRGGAGGPMSVAVAEVSTSDINITRSALGTVTPLATVTVRAKVSGTLQEVLFKEGQLVKQGDILAIVDPKRYQLALEQAQGQLGRDEALLKDAQINLARYEKLMKEDSIARQQLDTQKSLVNQYKAAIKSDQAAVNNAKIDLSYTSVIAPISGRVGLRQVDAGNYVQISDANGLVLLTEIQPIAVVFTLPEDDLAPVLAKVNAGAELEADAYDRTKSNKLATGKLIAIDNQIDATTGTVKMRAQFDNESQILFPNQFVNVTLLVDTLKGVSTVPSAAIQRGVDGTFVYQVKADKTVALHKVQVGVTDGDKVQITSDLNPGDQVVTDGADKLKEGAKVNIPEPGSDKPAPDEKKPGVESKEPSPATPTVEPEKKSGDSPTPSPPSAP